MKRAADSQDEKQASQGSSSKSALPAIETSLLDQLIQSKIEQSLARHVEAKVTIKEEPDSEEEWTPVCAEEWTVRPCSVAG